MSDTKIISFNPNGVCVCGSSIDLDAIRQSGRKLKMGLISPASEPTHCELAPEQTSEPIKSVDDVNRISEYFIENGRYRDNMLFIVGINFGLRVSDLRSLRFSSLINPNCTFRDSFPVFEKKTRRTRARKKNRHITVNTAVVEAVTLYLENTTGVSLSDYMFRSESNNGRSKNIPLSITAIDNILKDAARALHLSAHISTHSLRKTFGYHQMLMSNNDHRKLLLLQKIFNHSTPAQTLDYIGITGEEIEEAYRKLNLGSVKHNYLVDSNIIEFDDMIG